MQLTVVEGDSKLAVDLREAEQAPGWVLEAKTNMPTARVTLTWPDLSQVPRDYRAVLVDLDTGTRRYMRTTSSYSYTSGKEGGTRRFRIEMAREGERTLAITGVSAAQMGSGLAELRISLSDAAIVDIEVLNIAGRPVATVCHDRHCEAGLTTLSWSGMSDSGCRPPNGLYLIRVAARAEAGAQVTALGPLRVHR